MIKYEPETLEELLTQARTVIVSLEADLSLGCLSTTPNESIIVRLKKLDEILEKILTVHNYDAGFLITHSGYVTIAKRKYLY